MAITYPLSLPAFKGPAKIDFHALSIVSSSKSPFTLKEQIYEYGGQIWQADITLPPMRRSDAENWVAFLLALHGRTGTFILTDPTNAAPRGNISSSLVITGSVGANSVTCTMTGSLAAGDMFQLGSGAATELHKVVQGRTGSGTLEIWPSLRYVQASATAVIANPGGLFRLNTNDISWSVDEASVYGITFPAIEALP